MNPAQLPAWLAAHRTEALGVGAAAVAGLALYSRKRKAAAGGSGVTAGAVAPGTIPAASVVGATADSSAFDAYNALQDEIGTLARNSDAARNTGATGSGVGAGVTPPIASTLFAPSGTGNIVRFGDGYLGEVETDGSVFGMTLGQNADAVNAARAAGKLSWNQLNANAPSDWSTEANLARVAAQQKPNPATSGA